MNIAPDFASYESVGKEVRDFCYQSESRHKHSPADQTAFRGHKGLWDVYCKRNKVSGEQDSPSTSPSMLTCESFTNVLWLRCATTFSRGNIFNLHCLRSFLVKVNGFSVTQFVHCMTSLSPIFQEILLCQKTHLSREMGKTTAFKSFVICHNTSLMQHVLLYLFILHMVHHPLLGDVRHIHEH